jgi:transposase
VRVPGATDEAVRDFVRVRHDGVRECRNARHRLKALLLPNGIPYTGKCSWTAAHMCWYATLKPAQPAQQTAFQEYLHSIMEATAEARTSTVSADWRPGETHPLLHRPGCKGA